ncbi:hypothetical protein FRACYDRAFT_249656 [Fragilariopsis cylindrus CCMP1102]|uniref:Uncharacterized protein n=1 Tax=Fragilariopsis cylindrus CCMP1102 TaxID=635003 RepID=A0A1E7ERV3_9STRA|nr:hypothetical protein FRACYDRAFT_249656 [Fragilariopsis cylindrus CCMP1102]|eukprot:OEU08750.1 hypothetical protein FRACYDRAFT_249656 [Fragilariopsis cylindrus CCMP1102]
MVFRVNNNNSNNSSNNTVTTRSDTTTIPYKLQPQPPQRRPQLHHVPQQQRQRHLVQRQLVSDFSTLDLFHGSGDEKAGIFFRLATVADRRKQGETNTNTNNTKYGGSSTPGILKGVISNHSSSFNNNNKLYRNVFVGKDIIDSIILDGRLLDESQTSNSNSNSRKRKEVVLLGNILAHKLNLFSNVNGIKKKMKMNSNQKKNAGIAQTLLLGGSCGIEEEECETTAPLSVCTTTTTSFGTSSSNNTNATNNNKQQQQQQRRGHEHYYLPSPPSIIVDNRGSGSMITTTRRRLLPSPPSIICPTFNGSNSSSSSSSTEEKNIPAPPFAGSTSRTSSNNGRGGGNGGEQKKNIKKSKRSKNKNNKEKKCIKKNEDKNQKKSAFEEMFAAPPSSSSSPSSSPLTSSFSSSPKKKKSTKSSSTKTSSLSPKKKKKKNSDKASLSDGDETSNDKSPSLKPRKKKKTTMSSSSSSESKSSKLKSAATTTTKTTKTTTKDRLLPVIKDQLRLNHSDDVVGNYDYVVNELQYFISKTMIPQNNMLSSAPSVTMLASRKNSLLPSDISIDDDDNNKGGSIDQSYDDDDSDNGDNENTDNSNSIDDDRNSSDDDKDRNEEDSDPGDHFMSLDELITSNALLPTDGDENNSVWTEFITGKKTSTSTRVETTTSNTLKDTACTTNTIKKYKSKTISTTVNTVEEDAEYEENDIKKTIASITVTTRKNQQQERVWKGPAPLVDGNSSSSGSSNNVEIDLSDYDWQTHNTRDQEVEFMVPAMELPTVDNRSVPTFDDVDIVDDIPIEKEQQPYLHVHRSSCDSSKNPVDNEEDDDDDIIVSYDISTMVEHRQLYDEDNFSNDKKQHTNVKAVATKHRLARGVRNASSILPNFPPDDEEQENNDEIYLFGEELRQSGNFDHSGNDYSYSGASCSSNSSDIMQAIEDDQFYQEAIHDRNFNGVCNYITGATSPPPPPPPAIPAIPNSMMKTSTMVLDDETTIDDVDNAFHSSLPKLDEFSVHDGDADYDEDTSYSSYVGSYLGSYVGSSIFDSNILDGNGDDDQYDDDYTYVTVAEEGTEEGEEGSCFEEETVCSESIAEDQTDNYQDPRKFRSAKSLKYGPGPELESEQEAKLSKRMLSLRTDSMPPICEDQSYCEDENQSYHEDQSHCGNQSHSEDHRPCVSFQRKTVPVDDDEMTQITMDEDYSNRNPSRRSNRRLSVTSENDSLHQGYSHPMKEEDNGNDSNWVPSEFSSERIKQILQKGLTSNKYDIVWGAMDQLRIIVDAGGQSRTELVKLCGVMNIIGAMEQHFETEEIQSLCCLVLGQLASSNIDTKNHIDLWGGTELIKQSMKRHAHSDEIRERGRAALATLSSRW